MENSSRPRGNPAQVVGNGVQTIAQLIESQLNTDPRRGKDMSFPLDKIELGPPVLLLLDQQGYRADSVPVKGQTVMIQRNGNLAFDVTDDVHPEYVRMAALAARVVGLDVAGIDLLTDDVSRSPEEQRATIIEVNAGPGLQMHVQPESGKPRPVGEAILATLIPEGQDGRIPLVSVMGAEHTAIVSRWVARLLTHTGREVGLASVEGMFVGDTIVKSGDCRGADDARSMLLHPYVEAAVFEASLDGILQEGLGFDRCHVAVVTAIGEGLKLDFAEWDSPEKKALIYRTASDVVLPGGAVVLKAGEPLGSILAQKCGGSLILFSTDEREPALAAHRAGGGNAVFARGGRIVLAEGRSETDLAQLPPHEPADAILAAAAAARACAMPAAKIAVGLKSPGPG